MKIEKLLADATPRPWPVPDFAENDPDYNAVSVVINSADALVALVKAARILYEETADYIQINKLSAMNNRSMVMMREALAALPPEWREE